MVHYDEDETITIFIIDYIYSKTIEYSYFCLKSQFIDEDETY